MKHKIHFRSLGEKGPLYILLFGYGGSPRHWQSVAEHLSKNNRVIIPHLSSLYMSKDPLFFTVQVELVLQFIEDHFQNEIIRLAGVSYGGLLAWAMSLQKPSIFERVHLINPMLPSALDHVQIPELKFMLRVPFNFQALSLLLSTPMGKQFLKKTSAILGNDPERDLLRMDDLKGRKLIFVAQMIHHFSWILKNEDWSWWKTKSLSESQQRSPTELLVSEDDPLFSLQTYQSYFRQQKFDHLQVVKTGGHLLPLSTPQLVFESLNSEIANRNPNQEQNKKIA